MRPVETKITAEAEVSFNTFNLFELSPSSATFQKLQEKIASQHCSVFVLVHPFFEGWDKVSAQDWISLALSARRSHPQFPAEFHNRLENHPVLYSGDPNNNTAYLGTYILKLNQLLKVRGNDCLLIAEETDKIATTTQIFRALGFTGQLLFYPTISAAPEPDIQTATTMIGKLHQKILHLLDRDYKHWGLTPQTISNQKWNQLAQKLRQLGCQQLLVGGQYSHLSRENLTSATQTRQYHYDTHTIPQLSTAHHGCVGGFMSNILKASLRISKHQEKNLRITLSPIAYPDSHFE